MSTQIINRVLSVGEGRTMKTLLKRAKSVADLEDEYGALDIAGIRAKTAELKERHRDGEDLDDLMQESFALVRYTITLLDEGSIGATQANQIRTLMRNCATPNSKCPGQKCYYDSPSPAELETAFYNIAKGLKELRVSR